MLYCVTQCSQSEAHLCEYFLQVRQIGFVTLGFLCTGFGYPGTPDGQFGTGAEVSWV